MNAAPAIRPNQGATCGSCGAILTAEESKFYGHSCEACERVLHATAQQGATPATPTAEIAHIAPARMPSPVLVLPEPISANRYWRSFVPRGGKRAIVVVSDEAKAYKREVAKLAMAAGTKPVQGRVALAVKLYPARPQDFARRARNDPDSWDDGVRCIDLDNALKVLLDALKGIAFGDDSWVRKITAERCEPDEHGARVAVTITPIVRERVAPELFA